MITFQSKNINIRYADRITRMAKSTYPHRSESKMHVWIDNILQNNLDDAFRLKLCNKKLKNATEIDNMRNGAGNGLNYYRNVIDFFKNKKLGNCYEESILAQIIGKINGINNIYTARILFNMNRSGAQQRLYHTVSVITDKPFEKGYKYTFKNKDAIIIDPWLGITEFAGEYFNKLRTNFGNIFPYLKSNDSSVPLSVSKTKSLKEYNKIRKEHFKTDFSLSLVEDNLESNNFVIQLKKEFPELIIK